MTGNTQLNRFKFNLSEKLERSRIYTIKDLLSYNEYELIDLLDASYNEIKELYQQVCKTCFIKPKNVWEIYSMCRTRCLPLCPDYVNDYLVHPGVITEISASSGMGKSQYLTITSLLTALPENTNSTTILNDFKAIGNVFYIDLDGTFNSSRILEIASNAFPALISDEYILKELLKHIIVFKIHTVSEIFQLFNNLEEQLISDLALCIIVDCIATPFRNEYSERSKLIQRQEKLANIASKLKYWGESLTIPIIVTNQIFGQDNTALGISWYHAINTRFILESTYDGDGKQIRIAKSPLHSTSDETIKQYIITKNGIELKKNI